MLILLIVVIIILFFFVNRYRNQKRTFDIVVPVGPNDATIFHQQIPFTKKNIIGYRNIYVISPKKPAGEESPDYIWVPESSFPFSINDIARIHGRQGRNGWYLQQLLKLYSGRFIPGILPCYLVIDADTFFLKPTVFFRYNTPLYATSGEYHVPYFQHIHRLDQTIRKHMKESAICHHMMFETRFLDILFQQIEKSHHKPFWTVFLEKVEEAHRTASGASEYELYLNFMLTYFPRHVRIRRLRFKNSSSLLPLDDPTLDFKSVHWYMRDKKGLWARILSMGKKFVQGISMKIFHQ